MEAFSSTYTCTNYTTVDPHHINRSVYGQTFVKSLNLTLTQQSPFKLVINHYTSSRSLFHQLYLYIYFVINIIDRWYIVIVSMLFTFKCVSKVQIDMKYSRSYLLPVFVKHIIYHEVHNILLDNLANI
jgi:hypothetical protein